MALIDGSYLSGLKAGGGGIKKLSVFYFLSAPAVCLFVFEESSSY